MLGKLFEQHLKELCVSLFEALEDEVFDLNLLSGFGVSEQLLNFTAALLSFAASKKKRVYVLCRRSNSVHFLIVYRFKSFGLFLKNSSHSLLLSQLLYFELLCIGLWVGEVVFVKLSYVGYFSLL